MPRPDKADRDIPPITVRNIDLKPETVIGQFEEKSPSPEIPENVTGIDLNNLDEADYPLFEKFFEFIRELNTAITEQEFISLTENPTDWGLPRQKIVAYLKDHKLDQPGFRILSRIQLGEAAKNLELLLDETNRREFVENDWFCVFTLPKPLDRFWFKGLDPDQGGKEAQGVIQWGKIYDRAIRQVWGLKEDYESATGLTLSRLNESGIHVPGKYYYVWGIRLAAKTDPVYL